MLGARSASTGLAVLVAVLGSSTARAQQAVPGGWAEEVGFLAFL